MRLKKSEVEFERSLSGVLYVLKKSILGMIITGVIFGGTAGVVSETLIKPKYSAMSSLYIVSASESLLKMADLEIGSSLTSDYIYLITSRPFITEVKQKLGLGPEYTYNRIKGMITVSNPSDTHAIEIETVSTDDKLAADISNALAEVSVTKLADIMESSHPKIIEYAAARNNKISPNSTMNAIVSAILGIIAYFIISFFRSVSDDTIKSFEDIENLLELNILGMINLGPAKKSSAYYAGKTARKPKSEESAKEEAVKEESGNEKN